MLDKVKELIGDVEAFKATTKEDVEAFRIKYLGSKGLLKGLFAEFKNVDAELRKDFGQALNTLKKSAEGKVVELNESLDNNIEEKGIYGDLTRPSEPIELGSRHPISLVKNQIIDVFNRIGFTVSEGPEIEDDWHNFTALNLPEYHPARDMKTLFLLNKIQIFYYVLIHLLYKCVIWKTTHHLLEQFLQGEFLETKIFLQEHIVFFIK